MAHADNLPHWPRLLSADLAAGYVGIGETNFLAGVEAGRWPKPIAYGRRHLWDRLALDEAVDRLSGKTSEHPDGHEWVEALNDPA